MAGASNYLESAILNHTLAVASSSYAAPASVWVGLCSTDPSDTASGEITAPTTYARKQVYFTGTNTSSIGGSSAAVTFAQATGTSWGAIHGYAIFDSSSGGNMLYYANLASDVTINVNDQAEFATNAIVITLD